MVLINGYISLDMLYEYAMNSVDKTVSPNEFMRMPKANVIPIEWIKRYIAEEGIYPNRELLSVEQADAIERMIENWEKENG